MSKNFILNLSDGENLQITTYGLENFESSPVIIHVHGFKGFKDWGFNPFLAGYFASLGYFVITFNFSHNGIGDNPMEFTRLDKFAENTLSREVNELNAVIDAYKSGFFGSEGKNKIGIIGHSRGGGVSLMAAEHNKNIDAIALWAAISDADRFSYRQKAEWKKTGYIESVNTRTKQVMRMNYSLIQDIIDNNLCIERSIKNINIPVLICQGEQDLAVALSEAEKLYEWSNKASTELFVISATGHTFNCRHPFEGTNEKFDKLLLKTKEFFERAF